MLRYLVDAVKFCREALAPHENCIRFESCHMVLERAELLPSFSVIPADFH